MSLEEHEWFPKLSEPALCAETDPDIFFPEVGLNGSAGNLSVARRTCKRCLAQPECLEWALSYPDNLYGIWGGTTWAQRRRIRNERAA